VTPLKYKRDKPHARGDLAHRYTLRVMPVITAAPQVLDTSQARRIWLRAQRLDERAPFGHGPAATALAVEHLGYVQIDTIHVIERCHHHILYTRIPSYHREHLHRAQSVDKSVFEYWTHALAYVPTRDFPFFVRDMNRRRRSPHAWFGDVPTTDLRRVLSLLRRQGPLTIRDIDDDVLLEKDHPWVSRKPSKKALQVLFNGGVVTVSRRSGMLKTYELMDRHFGWARRPSPASPRQVLEHVLDRALRAQGVVSLDSICHLDARRKPLIRGLIEARVRRGTLVPIALNGADARPHWASPETLDTAAASVGPAADLVHILSPFDPLIIQRKRLLTFFGYDHVFEAYVPKPKRRFGYFALPVLAGDEIVAAIDLKTDRQQQKLLIQQWTWVGRGSARRHKRVIEEELHRFERFQLARQDDRAV
jgi:uncharacterized protein